jgi:hypothetical protein
MEQPMKAAAAAMEQPMKAAAEAGAAAMEQPMKAAAAAMEQPMKAAAEAGAAAMEQPMTNAAVAGGNQLGTQLGNQFVASSAVCALVYAGYVCVTNEVSSRGDVTQFEDSTDPPSWPACTAPQKVRT